MTPIRILIPLLYLLSVSAVHAATIDFEEWRDTPTADVPNVLPVSQGYIFTPELGDELWLDFGPDTATTFIGAIGLCQNCSPAQGSFLGKQPSRAVRMRQADGLSFDLLGFRYSNLTPFSGGTSFLTVIGQKADGAVIEVNGLSADNTSVLFTSEQLADFTNLESVQFIYELDDPFELNGRLSRLTQISVSTVVPIPAAVWLFASSLGLLGWMRRKVN
jgi:hypothetical protein